MKKRKKRLLILPSATLLALLGAGICYLLFFAPSRTFAVTETYAITSMDGSETYLNVSLPASGGYQDVSDYTIEGADDYSIKDYDGWNELTVRIPAGENTIKISYSVKLDRNVAAWEGDVRDEYLMPQQYVDSDNDDVVSLAKQLRGGSDYETAENIADYVHKVMSPMDEQENSGQLKASELLKHPVGVCNDYAILMTALLRADGIPARKIGGLSLQIPLGNATDWNHPGVAHAWVEFYADGVWHFADPTWGRFGKTDVEHLSYGTAEDYIDSSYQQGRMNEVRDLGFLVNGQMSAPLKFMVYSTDEDALVTPRADVGYSLFR
jgi:transglutaminase-like putative cysteine protease